jgi:hypothetical protein
MNSGDSIQEFGGIEVPVNVRLWRVPGCHELLASLGFDLMEVGREDVTLKTGKSANRRQIQFALQALLALFDPQDAPRSLEIDDEVSEEGSEEIISSVENEEPLPSPRKSFVLDSSQSSAFTSYIRKRGEPDGRQAGNPDSPTTQPNSSSSSSTSTPLSSTFSKVGPMGQPIQPHFGLYQNQSLMHPKGHESDCNFTPSPVDPMMPRALYGERSSKMFGTLPSDQGSPITNQIRLARGMFNSRYNPNLDDSSSSAGSLYESRNHHHHPTLALRQAPPLAQMRRQALHQTNKSAQHLHPTVHQRINQAITEIASDVANVSALRSMGTTVPLYENTDFTTRQPAGRRIMPIRSVFTDVGYQSTLKLQDKSDPNDKFSVRTEVSKTSNGKGTPTEQIPTRKVDSVLEERLNPGVIKRVPPTGESGSPDNTLPAPINQHQSSSSSETGSVKNEHLGEQGIKDTIFSSQMRRLNRELPISDVYHERNLGLGMAPPLSTLIMTSNLQVVHVDHHSSDSESNSQTQTVSPPPLVLPQQLSPFTSPQPLSMQSLMKASLGLEESFSNIDNLSMIEDAHQRNSLASSSRTVIIKDTPQGSTDPRQDFAQAKPAYGHTTHQHHKQPGPQRRPPVPPRPQEAWYNTGLGGHYHHHRDEGDGRSMTDSQYSGCSPSGNQKPGHHQMKPDSLASQINYMKMRDYMNDQEITVLEEKEVSPPIRRTEQQQQRDNFNPGFAVDEQQQVKLKPKEIANYINTQFKMPLTSSGTTSSSSSAAAAENAMKRRPISIGPGQASPLDRNTRHPQQIWDKNSGFTYTGMFSSDC